MTDLSEFLLARISEDEEIARLALADQWRSNVDTLVISVRGGSVLVGTGPSRAVAECEAKRRIVREYSESCGEDRSIAREPANYGLHIGLLHALEALALPYAHHPDYDPAWRP